MFVVYHFATPYTGVLSAKMTDRLAANFDLNRMGIMRAVIVRNYIGLGKQFHPFFMLIAANLLQRFLIEKHSNNNNIEPPRWRG